MATSGMASIATSRIWRVNAISSGRAGTSPEFGVATSTGIAKRPWSPCGQSSIASASGLAALTTQPQRRHHRSREARRGERKPIAISPRTVSRLPQSWSRWCLRLRVPSTRPRQRPRMAMTRSRLPASLWSSPRKNQNRPPIPSIDRFLQTVTRSRPSPIEPHPTSHSRDQLARTRGTSHPPRLPRGFAASSIQRVRC